VTTKRFVSVPALVGALGLVAGCGGEPFPKTQAPTHASVPATATPNTGATPHARLLAAVKRTTDAQTARVSLSLTFSGVGTDVPTMSGNGLIDLERRRMQMTFAETIGGKTTALEMRVIGRDLYIHFDGQWAKVPVSSADPETPSPTTYLEYLQAIAGDVHAEGGETLRGEPTTRYGATLDLSRALAHAGSAAQRSVLEQAAKGLGSLKFPTTVWLDDFGRLRKVSMTLDFSADAARLETAAGSRPKIALTMELYDFGVPANVRAPAGAIDPEATARDRAAQSDLRNALTAEKVVYTDTQEYNATVANMKAIEPSLDWGGKLTVVLGSADGSSANTVVCLSEKSTSGTTFAILDVGVGSEAGTYYAKTSCPLVVSESSVAMFGRSW
jgi:hypothetical protein